MSWITKLFGSSDTPEIPASYDGVYRRSKPASVGALAPSPISPPNVPLATPVSPETRYAFTEHLETISTPAETPIILATGALPFNPSGSNYYGISGVVITGYCQARNCISEWIGSTGIYHK